MVGEFSYKKNDMDVRASHVSNQQRPCFRKCGGVQKSMGNKVPWKIGMLIYLPVTS